MGDQIVFAFLVEGHALHFIGVGFNWIVAPRTFHDLTLFFRATSNGREDCVPIVPLAGMLAGDSTSP
ncbi:MAG: hypothetical protein ACYDHX_07800 [Methanothrix sp.]